MKRFRSSLFLMLGAGLTLFSCVKQATDLPPDTSAFDPNLSVTTSIRELKAMNGPFDVNQSGADDTLLITQDLVAYGIVIANDKSGNFYKQIIIQDSTGGIALNIDDSRLYAQYPVGRKIYLKLKGMTLGYNMGTPVLGYGVSEQKAITGVSGSKINAHIIKASIGHQAKDTVVNFDAVRNFTLGADQELLNRLITIQDVQFADTSKAYAPTSDISRYILKCGNNTYTGTRPPAGLMAVRTSAYADFHTYKLPAGNGTITGIYTVYNTSPQMLIRDTSDVKFYNTRCDSTGTPPPPPSTGVTLLSEDFGSAITGDITLPGWANIAQFGSQKWKHSNAGSTTNPYARVSAFGSNDSNVVSWLITPAINLAGAANPRLSFKSARGFDNGATLQLMATSNFTGDVNTTVWTPLSFTPPASNGTGFSPFVLSANVSLSAFGSGSVWIAWKYVGSDLSGTADDKTTTWEVDDVKVMKD